MVTADYRMEDEFGQPRQGDRKKSWLMGCLLGCLIVIVAGVVLAIILAVWITRNIRDWGASSAAIIVKEQIKTVDLPPEEQKEIQLEIDRALDAFRERRLSSEQGMTIIQKLFDSPLMTALVVSAAEKKYLDGSGLNEQERKDAHVTLQRFLRGSMDDEIDEESIDAALRHVASRQPDASWRFRDKVSDEDLREFLAAAKKAADETQIPEQPVEFDPSDEIKRIIDESISDEAPAPGAAVPPEKQ